MWRDMVILDQPAVRDKPPDDGHELCSESLLDGLVCVVASGACQVRYVSEKKRARNGASEECVLIEVSEKHQ